MEHDTRQHLQNLIRVGMVVSTNPANGTCRVQFSDEENIVSFDLPVIHHKTLNNKYYDMPDIHEHVVCVFLANGLEQGFVLGAIYSDSDTTPVNSQDKAHIKFQDGTTIEYDRKEHHLVIDEGPANGDLTITCPQGCTINAQAGLKIHASGGILLDGPITYTSGLTGTGDAVIDGISHDHHVHGGVTPGGSTTAGPQ